MHWEQLFPLGTARKAVEPPIRAVIACVVSGKRVNDPLRDEILDLLSDIATSSEPAFQDDKIKDVWRKTLELVIKHISTFESRTQRIRDEMNSSTTAASQSIPLQRMQGHLTDMRRVRKFFQAYPKFMGQDLEWQDNWRRITLGQSRDSLVTANFPELDRNTASSQLSSTVRTDNETSLQRGEDTQYDNGAVDAISPKMRPSTNGEKFSTDEGDQSGVYFFSLLLLPGRFAEHSC